MKQTGLVEVYKKEPEEEMAEVTKGWIAAGHTKPVARDLALLERIGLLEAVEGHTKGMTLYPFAVYLKSGEVICRATELHRYVKERREK